LFGRCFPLHLSGHHLQSEYVEVDGMNMSEVEGINMLDVDEHPLNQQSEVEGIDMMSIHMVKMEGINMVEKQPSKQCPEVEGIDMVEERPSKQRPEVEGMNMTSMNTVEATTTKVDVEVVEREHEGVVLVKH
jgi:hypothetical protein